MAGSIELIVGLVGPIGANLEAPTQIISEFLESVGYEVSRARISDWFNVPREARDSLDGYRYFMKLMDEGDKLRSAARRKDACAAIAAAQIAQIREGATTRNTAVLVRQFKTPEELATMRRIYGNRLVVISCYCSRSNRVYELSHYLADRAHEIQVSRFRGDAEKLIERDEQDEANEWGQNVRKTFPNADVFVSVDDRDGLRTSLQRAFEIIFSHPYHTPTRDECGMYQAEAAALRSAALGRQVGAVITTTRGDIVSVGANEVPKAGGGLYWEGDSPDRRDFTLSVDSNDLFKEKVLGEIVRRLRKAKWLRKRILRKDLHRLLDKLMYDEQAILSGTQIDNIIEFGRCVHAEMAAIVDAARRGVAVDGCVLYTTTFPCHECARHIVAAGIQRVVYRVPYPKSLVRELYPDSIDVDGNPADKSLVASSLLAA